ncbi:PRA1 family protein Jwa [Augochlora pura]
MAKVKSLSDGCKLPPLRGLKDFLLEPSGFQLPNFNDFEKWGNRVVNNLIYYQTNYLYMSLSIMLVAGFLHPKELVLGVLSIGIMYIFVFTEQQTLCQIRRQYPVVQTLSFVICACFLIYIVTSIFLVVLFTILLPICVTFVHASLRLRNIKNKLVNKIECLRIERTPMGIFLTYFDEWLLNWINVQ